MPARAHRLPDRTLNAVLALAWAGVVACLGYGVAYLFAAVG